MKLAVGVDGRQAPSETTWGVRGGGHGRREGALTTAMVHQDVLGRAPTDRTSEPGPQGTVASPPG